jgi:pyruvate formate lyase activating enzyme
MCGDCAEACPTKAIEMIGEEMSVKQVMAQIKREIILMDNSDGGVTISGGEPLLHHKFLLKLLDACGKEGIHRCVDTSGFASTKVLLKVASKAEHFLYDLKIMDDEKHKEWTGISNKIILENLKILAETDINMNIRIPLIKGVNDDDANIHESAKFIAALAGKSPKINILPFHNVAEKKYEKLGEQYNKEELDAPSIKRQNEVVEIFESYHLNAILGG